MNEERNEILMVNPRVGLRRAKAELRSVVIIEARNYDGRRLGLPLVYHDGTMESMVKKAMWLSSALSMCYDRVSHVNSRILGIDATGKCYAISPNGCHVAEVGTKEAAYIGGDVTARTE